MNSRTIFALLPVIIIWIFLYLLQNAWGAIIGYHALIIISILYYKNHEFKIFYRGFSKNGFWIILLGALAGSGIWLLWPYIKSGQPLGETLVTFGLSGNSLYLFFIYYIIATPFFEEFFWRHLLSSNDMGIDFTDFMFAAYHFPVLLFFFNPGWSGIIFVVLFITSWMWRACRLSYKGLIVPLISHFLADFSIIIAAYILI